MARRKWRAQLTAADMREMARTHTAMALRSLAMVCRSAKTPPSARVAAAEALLSRGWGKSLQPSTADGETELRITIRHIMEELKIIEGSRDDNGREPAAQRVATESPPT